MGREKFPVICTGLALIVIGVSCLFVDIPLKLIDRFFPQDVPEEEGAVSTSTLTAAANDEVEPRTSSTSTEVLEPTAAPTATATSLIDYQDTCMYRGNLARTGVYQSPGPKESPNLLWRFEAGGAIHSSPAIQDGVAYFGSDDGEFYALDVQSGEVIWSVFIGDKIRSSPAVNKDVIYFGSDNGSFYALEISTGEVLWDFETAGEIISSPAIFDEMVYFGSYDGFLYALDSQTGEEIWKFEVEGIVDPASPIHKTVRSSPAISNSIVLFGSDQNGGASKELVFYALDGKTGQKLWENSTWNFLSPPAVSDGVVYFGGFFQFHGLDVNTGSDVLGMYYDTNVTSAPALYDSTAYFGCDFGLLHAVDLDTAVERWVVDSGYDYPIRTAPSVSDGVVYFGSGDGFLIAVEIESEQILWKFNTKKSVTTSPVISQGVIFVGNEGGYLFALR